MGICSPAEVFGRFSLFPSAVLHTFFFRVLKYWDAGYYICVVLMCCFWWVYSSIFYCCFSIPCLSALLVLFVCVFAFSGLLYCVGFRDGAPMYWLYSPLLLFILLYSSFCADGYFLAFVILVEFACNFFIFLVSAGCSRNLFYICLVDRHSLYILFLFLFLFALCSLNMSPTPLGPDFSCYSVILCGFWVYFSSCYFVLFCADFPLYCLVVG